MPRKGITPIISIIVLLLITVALAGAAWTFLQGFIFPQITKAFVVPAGGAYCTGKNISVFVINTGYQSELLTPSDWVIASVDGIDIGTVSSGITCPSYPDTNYLDCGLINVTIPTGESMRVVYWDCAPGNGSASCGSGSHTVDLGTTSTIYHLSVFCP